MTTRSALFIDFDNFFSGLLSADPAAALKVVERPSVWLSGLSRDESGELSRRWLVLRCYMNPAGSVLHPLHPGERLYFSKFRPFFTQAGIEVVDCPPLTARGKNGADIRIVVDCMTALNAPAHYEEFVIASSDADFTPLLQVLRASDRRITVISTGASSGAYEALADQLLDEQDVLELASPARTSSPSSEEDEVPPDGSSQVSASAWTDEDYDEFADATRSIYVNADEPINLARLAGRLIADVGDVTTGSRWFGTGGFEKALKKLDLPRAEMSNNFLWDPDRHTPPSALPAASESSGEQLDLPAVIAKFRQVAKLPAVSPRDWRQVHKSLAAYAISHEYDLTESTRWSRDDAAESGRDVGRKAFAYTVRACQNAGRPLYGDPPPDADQIAAALLSSVLAESRQAGLEGTDDEIRALAEWVGADHRGVQT